MTEAEWIACTDPRRMLAFLRDRGKFSERKGRLFAVAVCRRIWHLLSDERSRTAVDVAERYADGEAGEADLQAAQDPALEREEAGWAANAAWCVAEPGSNEPPPGCYSSYFYAATTAAFCACRALGGGVEQHPNCNIEETEQTILVRDIFGPFPFCPLTLPPPVRTWNGDLVQRLAAAAYEHRLLPSGHLDPQRIAVLADALEEAGADAALVAHLRDSGPHYRGCWAVDLALGRE